MDCQITRDGITPGRIVHYVNADLIHVPAMILTYNGATGTVDLIVYAVQWDVDFNQVLDIQYHQDVRYSPSKDVPDTWHWIKND